jgi:hypothetical protein
MAEPIKKRVPRSVSIEANVYKRIVDMSDRLGVNVNAYLLDAIGQKLFRDESLLRIEQSTADATVDSLNKMVEMVSQMSEKENPSKD